MAARKQWAVYWVQDDGHSEVEELSNGEAHAVARAGQLRDWQTDASVGWGTFLAGWSATHAKERVGRLDFDADASRTTDSHGELTCQFDDCSSHHL